jgi:hypothetical protein
MPRVLHAQRKISPVVHPEARIVPKGLNLVVVMGEGALRQTSMVSGRPVSRRTSFHKRENRRGEELSFSRRCDQS